MKFAAGALLVLLFILIAAPLFVSSPAAVSATHESRQLIIFTPHNEQIRAEFAQAFSRWHQRVHGEAVSVVWNVPGGTSDIRRMLEAQFEAALRDGRPVGGNADLVFGGGAQEHQRLARGVTVRIGDDTRTASISQPVRFDRAWLLERYGGDHIGASPLFDPKGHWFGVVLSGFGIVSNRHALAHLGVSQPSDWRDLADPRLLGWISLGHPAQSGSIAKSFDTILQREGWREGWQVLRRMGANARSFSASSSKVPMDVSQGDAAAGVCIDFYGRFQAQALAEAGDADRIGYVDAPGMGAIDPDPISMIAGAPEPELARRFIEFCLTDEGQALWQFRHDDPEPEDLGPRRYELRRLPIVRSMYERHFDRFIDRVNPYELADESASTDPTFAPFVSLLFTAMAIDNHDELRRAWEAIVTHPGYPAAGGVVTGADITDPTLAAMLRAFDAMPDVPGPDQATYSLDSPEHLATIAAGWLRRGWSDAKLWNENTTPDEALRNRFSMFFRQRFDEVLRLAESAPR